MIAACSARESTLYLSKDELMAGAACAAVAHSSFEGAESQDLDLGAMVSICWGVMLVSFWISFWISFWVSLWVWG